ncbi:hypothetical protein H8R23_03935 [Flavobacterium sp. F-380]|uniref:Uncharacterized protein n=1 Tax=Flavobacterium kayseriense TaxID=2764714 RepID=A0ABR7J532_9FLAO|nr:hypothetical protein [Flavobacterium kayseriense]MBC5840546.1 hypothetical protein [Flavobacterium kayseriense]MBC5846784.1 hypothetical protein [Flavobacterium kayseriense]MBU0942776.1 hypothetical protein [Bacteroidota bacterium]
MEKFNTSKSKKDSRYNYHISKLKSAMTIISRKLPIIICLGWSLLSFSQHSNKSENTTVLINLNDSSIANFCINNEKTKAQFSFYLKGYETKQAIIAGVKKSKNGLSTSLGIPTFIFTLYSSTIFSPKAVKPENIKTLKGIKYITLKEFQNNHYKSSTPTYIIHKINNGTYLKWTTYYMTE